MHERFGNMMDTQAIEVVTFDFKGTCVGFFVIVTLSVLHTILLRSTFDQGLIKIFQIVQKSWNGHGRVMDRWTGGWMN